MDLESEINFKQQQCYAACHGIVYFVAIIKANYKIRAYVNLIRQMF